MNLSQLHYFKKLAEVRHFTRAAKELFITQPTLSDAIASLEKELGTPLFLREGRSVEVTVYGDEFYEYVLEALNHLDEGIAAIRKRKDELSGVINLGTAFTTLDDYLHPLLQAFNTEHQLKVRINTFQGFTNYLTQGLHDKLFDVVFCGKREEEVDIEYIPVLYRDLVLCVHENHPLAKHKQVSFSEISSQSLYTYHRGTPIGEQVNQLLHRYRISHGAQVYDDDITMASFLSFNSDAVGLMLDSIGLKLFSNLKTVKVKEVPSEFYWVYLAYHRRYIRSSTVNAFIAFVREYELNKVPHAKMH